MCLACIEYSKDKMLGKFVFGLGKLVATGESSEEHAQYAFQKAMEERKEEDDLPPGAA